jgi:23S rRNA pseudouridine2457 synthase
MHNYYIIHKPYQVLCQFSAEANKLTLKDVFDVPNNVYPVGRLDYDSEGLLLLTNDGTLTNKLLHPTNAHQRTYWVQVDGQITNEAIAQLAKGVYIAVDGKKYMTKPCEATMLTGVTIPDRIPPIRVRKNIPTTWLQLTLTEGKNRQVRKMTAAVGYPTLRLIRYSIENVNIKNLPAGHMINISKSELFGLLFK